MLVENRGVGRTGNAVARGTKNGFFSISFRPNDAPAAKSGGMVVCPGKNRGKKMPIKTIIEPFRIKSIEPIRRTTRGERQRLMEAAGYNLFLAPSSAILLDLLSDPRTAAMSTEHSAAKM